MDSPHRTGRRLPDPRPSAALWLLLAAALAGCGGAGAASADGGGSAGAEDTAGDVDGPLVPDGGPDLAAPDDVRSPADGTAPPDAAADASADATSADANDVSAACAGAPVARGTVAEGDCVPPGLVVHLDGSGSRAADGDPVARYRWQVDAPSGAAARFVPSAEFRSPTVELNLAGTYRFSLDVWDDDGRQSCAPGTAEVVVTCCGGVQVELRWTTPGDPDETDTGPSAGSDLDLHVLHPLAPSAADAADADGDGAPDPCFDLPYDCWWWNRQVVKEAFAAKVIADGQVWIDMLNHRNLLAHTYDAEVFAAAVEAIAARYLPAMAALHAWLGAPGRDPGDTP